MFSEPSFNVLATIVVQVAPLSEVYKISTLPPPTLLLVLLTAQVTV